MSSDQLLVILYLIAWVVTFIYYLKKRKTFDASCFIMVTYILYAICSFMLYYTSYKYFNPRFLKLFPFIYLYVMLLVGLLPIMKFNTTGGIVVQQPKQKLLDVFSVIFIISTLIHFPSSIRDIVSGLTLIMASEGKELYQETLEGGLDAGHTITNLAAVISNAFTQVGFLLTIYYLTIEKKKRWIVIGLFMASIMKMLNGIASAQRGAIVEPLLVLVATFFLLKNYMKPVYRRVASFIGVGIVVVLLVPVVFITISRFESEASDPVESTLYYMGIENINFNNYALDDNGIRYGDRTVPLFKRMLGFNNVPKNFFERRDKYPNLYINDDTFSTYVGDIAIDYGPYLTVVILCMLSHLISKKTKIINREYKFHQLLLIHFWIYMCVIGGIKLFPYADTGGNLKIIVLLIVYYIFKNDYYKNTRTTIIEKK